MPGLWSDRLPHFRIGFTPSTGEEIQSEYLVPRANAVSRALGELEAALAPFDARPHWSKLFIAEADAIAPLYERLPDFRSLVERYDPRGAFRNAWLEHRMLGSP